jgi:hypothetical protein
MRAFLTLTACGLLTVATAAGVRAADEAPACADVVAAMELAGGSESADEIAKQKHTTVEHVRKCWAEYDAARKTGGSGAAK